MSASTSAHSALFLKYGGGDYDCYITFHRSSFMDFLHAQERSKDYHIEDRESHTLVAQWVLQAFTIGM